MSADTREVRELINSPQGMIEVYEPTIEDIAQIIEWQHDNGFGMGNDTISFEAVDVLKKLFPLLTNIDFSNVDDEALQKVIDRPSIHLLIAQQIIAQIVAEANKLYAQRMKTQLLNAESSMAQVELINTMPSLIVETAKRNGRVGELLEKAEKIGNELEEAIKKEELETPNTDNDE